METKIMGKKEQSLLSTNIKWEMWTFWNIISMYLDYLSLRAIKIK